MHSSMVIFMRRYTSVSLLALSILISHIKSVVYLNHSAGSSKLLKPSSHLLVLFLYPINLFLAMWTHLYLYIIMVVIFFFSFMLIIPYLQEAHSLCLLALLVYYLKNLLWRILVLFTPVLEYRSLDTRTVFSSSKRITSPMFFINLTWVTRLQLRLLCLLECTYDLHTTIYCLIILKIGAC